MPSSDGIDPLDPRFPIDLGPQSPAFWDALALWEAYPSHSAQVFALEEAAHAVELNARQETAFVQPLPPDDPPAVTFAPRVYAELDPDTLAHDFAGIPLELLP